MAGVEFTSEAAEKAAGGLSAEQVVSVLGKSKGSAAGGNVNVKDAEKAAKLKQENEDAGAKTETDSGEATEETPAPERDPGSEAEAGTITTPVSEGEHAKGELQRAILHGGVEYPAGTKLSDVPELSDTSRDRLKRIGAIKS